MLIGSDKGTIDVLDSYLFDVVDDHYVSANQSIKQFQSIITGTEL